MTDMTDEQKAEYTAALIREREGDIRAGRDTTAVDAELARLGQQAKTPAKRAQTRTGR